MSRVLSRVFLRRSIATLAPLLLIACSALLNLQDDYSLAGNDAAAGSDGTTTSDGAPSDSHTDATFSEAGVDAASVDAPRLISPLTTATVSTQTPTITWVLPAGVEGAHVEICADRACATVQQTFDAAGTSGAPSTALTPGVHFVRLSGRTGPTVGNTFGPSYEILVPHRSSPRDTSYGVFPDFDGDGFADVVATGTTDTINVYPGAAAGPNDTNIIAIKNTLQSNDNSPRPAIGDVDGDGYTDLVVGEITQDLYPADSVNQIAIHRGGAGGLSATKSPDWIIHVPTLSDGGSVVAAFGENVSIPGDLNGDGYADILVASAATTNGSEDETGPTFIYFGHADGPSKIPDGQLSSDVTFGFACDGPIGDVNGDGFTDVICQANGVVFLFKGTATGPSNGTRDPLTIPTSAVVNGGGFGYLQTGAGDIDGDGLPDMLVGAYLAPRPDDGGPGPGQAYVYRGDTGVGLVTADWTVTGPDFDAGVLNFGASVSIVGDVNRDGYDDVEVGAAGGSYETGRAYFYPGGATGISDSVRTTMLGAGGWFGSGSPGGDLNGDGNVDALISDALGGTINVYYGEDGGISDTSTTTTVHFALQFIYYIATTDLTLPKKRSGG